MKIYVFQVELNGSKISYSWKVRIISQTELRETYKKRIFKIYDQVVLFNGREKRTKDLKDGD